LFYLGGGTLDSLPCQILRSDVKHLKKSGLAMTQPIISTMTHLF